MKGLILAAGLGTRLRPLTFLRAKPALPVLGVPALWFGAWHMKRELGVSEIAVNLSHLPETVRDAGEDQDLRAATGISFHYSDESSQILGSSGALWKLKNWIGKHEVLAVSNGDSISLPSWKKMVEFHRKSNALMTIHVRNHHQSLEAYTNVELDSGGQVKALSEKSFSGVMFSGSYLLDASLIAELPQGPSELRPSLMEPLIAKGKLFAFQEDIEWFDTGTISSYAHTQFELIRALPEVRELVEVKMREESAGVWVPRTWPHGSNRPAFDSPVVVTGEQSGWAAHSIVLGPRFLGIEPPPPEVSKYPFRDALVFSDQIESI